MSTAEIHFSKARLMVSVVLYLVFIVGGGYIIVASFNAVSQGEGRAIHPALYPMMFYVVVYSLYELYLAVRCLRCAGPGIRLDAEGIFVHPYNRCKPIPWPDITSVKLSGMAKRKPAPYGWWSLKIRGKDKRHVIVDSYFHGPQARDTVIDWLDQFAPDAERKGLPAPTSRDDSTIQIQ